MSGARHSAFRDLAPQRRLTNRRSLILGKRVIRITVQPALTRLGRSNDRMAAGMRVFAGVPIR